MFSTLSDRLAAIFQRLRSRGKLTESDVSEVLREVRVALLEADVNLGVVRDFIAGIRQRAVGAEVLESLTPAQAVIKIVRDGLVDLLGGTAEPLRFAPSGPTVVMLIGLQGSGKTTQAAKLAARLREAGRRPLLVACDVYRPAAITQLKTLGDQVDVPVYEEGAGDPVGIAKRALEQARRVGNGVVLLDTAGRLQIDEPLMRELASLKAGVEPMESLLVVDAMTGQEAVNVAKAFDERLALTGTILTKLDGDARGGAALSIREKVNALEEFHPDRLVSRILGMGDVLTLIEKSQRVMDEAKAKELTHKLTRSGLTLADFLEQLRQMRKMGPLADLVKMIPGMSKMVDVDSIDERDLTRVEAIICSMTPTERADPSVLNASRRRRIAKGSGTQVQDVNRLVKQFDASRQMMKRLGRMRMPFAKERY